MGGSLYQSIAGTLVPGVSSTLPRSFLLRANAERRSGQRRDGVDTWSRERSAACNACRCRGWCACGARVDAPRVVRCQGLMPYSSSAISAAMSDLMSSEQSKDSGLEEGREEGR